MGKDSTPNRHDGDRDGQGVYQPDKTENPQDYGRGRHQQDEPPEQDDRTRTTKGGVVTARTDWRQ
jgi:hypothetical protein